jgi:hypothetical protein
MDIVYSPFEPMSVAIDFHGASQAELDMNAKYRPRYLEKRFAAIPGPEKIVLLQNDAGEFVCKLWVAEDQTNYSFLDGATPSDKSLIREAMGEDSREH